MFKRSFYPRNRAGKAVRILKGAYSDRVKARLQDSLDSSFLASQLVTIVVGWERRLFAAHENVLRRSPWFRAELTDQYLIGAANEKQIHLPDEEPEILSCILEFLYKDDYTPRLLPDRQRGTWSLESTHRPGGDCEESSEPKPTIFHSAIKAEILRDTAVYCAADKYGLSELKRLALRKQGLQSGISIDVILRSIRYTYDNTPDSDGQLRAHFLALVIRARNVFKRSGTMQTEMEVGGVDVFRLVCCYV